MERGACGKGHAVYIYDDGGVRGRGDVCSGQPQTSKSGKGPKGCIYIHTYVYEEKVHRENVRRTPTTTTTHSRPFGAYFLYIRVRVCAMFNFLEGHPRYHPPPTNDDIRLIPGVRSLAHAVRKGTFRGGFESAGFFVPPPPLLRASLSIRVLRFTVPPPSLRVLSHIPHAPRASANNY